MAGSPSWIRNRVHSSALGHPCNAWGYHCRWHPALLPDEAEIGKGMVDSVSTVSQCPRWGRDFSRISGGMPRSAQRKAARSAIHSARRLPPRFAHGGRDTKEGPKIALGGHPPETLIGGSARF